MGSSIDVLKDASAEAIYGSRGANGVIVIETKRGQANETNINFDYSYGVQKIRKTIPMLKASQFAELSNDAYTNAGLPAPYSNPASLGEGTDWQGKLFRRAPMQNYHLSISGGNQDTRYSISGGFFKQDGIIRESNFARANLKVNLDKDVTGHLHIGNSLTLGHVISHGVTTGPASVGLPAGSGVVSKVLRFNPNLPVYQDNGQYTYQNNIGPFKIGNPIAEVNRISNVITNNRVLGNIFATYDLLEELYVKISFGGDAYFNNEREFVPNDLKRSIAEHGSASASNLEKYTWISKNTIHYDKTFSSANRMDLLAGFTVQGFNSNVLSAGANDFTSNITGYHDLNAAATNASESTYYSRWNLISYIGQINYSFKQKYLFTATARVDGSSKFGSGNKYGFFPSGAIAWRASDEPFIQRLGIFSNLKLRVSYGKTGNQEIAPYTSLALLNPVPTYFDESTVAIGYRPSNLSNPNLKWEETTQLDAGLDIGILNDRLSINFDYYRKNTSNLLLNSPIPLTTGFSSSLLNVGGLINQGIDIAINSTNLVGKFGWNTSLNFSLNRNEVTDLAERDSLILGNNILKPGHAVSSFYGYKTNGIFQQGDDITNMPQFAAQNAQPGDRRYKDINGDGILDSYDRTIIGGAQPDYTFGLTNNFFYKGIRLHVFVQGSVGNDVANINTFALEDFTGESNNTTAALKRWTPDNPSNKYPRANAQPEVGLLFSDAILEDASYLRIKNVTLSYNLPNSLLNQLGMRSLRFYATASNVFTLTGYDGYDPVVSVNGQTNVGRGVDGGTYPAARSVSIGFNIGL